MTPFSLTARSSAKTAAVAMFSLLAACAAPVAEEVQFPEVVTPEIQAQITPDQVFTIAVLPDTQNYLDYTHQKAEGFPFEASELFLEPSGAWCHSVQDAKSCRMPSTG